LFSRSTDNNDTDKGDDAMPGEKRKATGNSPSGRPRDKKKGNKEARE